MWSDEFWEKGLKQEALNIFSLYSILKHLLELFCSLSFIFLHLFEICFVLNISHYHICWSSFVLFISSVGLFPLFSGFHSLTFVRAPLFFVFHSLNLLGLLCLSFSYICWSICRRGNRGPRDVLCLESLLGDHLIEQKGNMKHLKSGGPPGPDF